MKFGRDWVLKTAQCHDGTAWGLEYVKGGPKGLGEALAGFQRADWLLWYLVKAEAVSIEMAFDFLWELLPARLETAECLELLYRIQNDPTPKNDRAVIERIISLRGEAAGSAESAMTLGLFRAGHEYSAMTFLLRFQLRMIEGDFDEALKDGQCVLNNVVAARTGSLDFETASAKTEHVILCDWLRTCVIAQKGS